MLKMIKFIRVISLVTLLACIGYLYVSGFAKGRHDPPKGNNKLMKDGGERIFEDVNKIEGNLDFLNNSECEARLALSSDGNTLLIGENRADVDGHDYDETGVAYILEKNGDVWVLKKKIIRDRGDCLGCAVALSADGNTALIGTSYTDHKIGNVVHNYGSAFFYEKNVDSWDFKQEIINPLILPSPSGFRGDGFGDTVSLSADGKVAVVGCEAGGYINTDGEWVEYAGKGYIYIKNGDTWQHQQTIEDPVITGKRDDGATLDDFGFFVKVSPDGNNLLITDPYEGGRTDGSAGNYGSLYFYERSGDSWELKQVLNNPFIDKETYEGLIGIEEETAFCDDWTTLLASFPCANGAGFEAEGGSLIYRKVYGSWQLQQTIKKNLGGYYLLGEGSVMSGDGNTILMSMAPVFTEMCDIMREWDLTGDSYLEQPNIWIDDPEPLIDFTSEFGRPSVLNYDGTIAVVGNKTNDEKTNLVSIYKKNRSVDFGWELLETVRISDDTTITIEPNIKAKSA